jgi:hypothetical protein
MKLLPVLMLLSTGVFAQSKPPVFEAQTIDDKVSIGYGLAIGDVDGDKKPDILLADKKQFVWYRNGDWKRFVMVDNLTEGDNVCIAARDIDGDGKVEVAVGAQWVPSETTDTLKSGSVHYLIRPKDPTKLWTPVKLHHEPTVHRMKWVKVGSDVNGKVRYQLVVVPLHGRGNKNGEGAGVKVIAYEMQGDPNQTWKYYTIDQSMHLTHNFEDLDMGSQGGITIGGKEGTKSFMFNTVENKWIPFGQKSWIKDTSFGELTTVSKYGAYVGITPMHGNQLILREGGRNNIITDDLNQGHALASSDLINSGLGQIIVGWREPNKDNKVGIKIFAYDPSLTRWIGNWIDDNTMACEDLQVADLDGDGKKEIIASGRSTHNLKIYWNKN